MQTNIDWEKKEERMAKLNATTNSTNFMQTLADLGIWKPKDMQEAWEDLLFFRNKIGFACGMY